MADSNSISVVTSSASSATKLRALKDRSAVRRKLLAQTLGNDLLATSSSSSSIVVVGVGDSSSSRSIDRQISSSVNDLSSDINNGSSTLSCSLRRRRDSSIGPPNSRTSASALSPEITNISSSSNLNGHASSTTNGEAFVVAKRLTDSGSSSEKKRRKTTTTTTGERSTIDSDGASTIMEPFDDYFQVLQEEEKVFRGSATFLKGTQSANPHNDYCQHFIDTGQRPQNFIRDSGLAERFDEYPKLKELIKLKDELVSNTATPPMYLKCDLRTYDLSDIGSRFDVILIEPPLEENHISGRDSWTWDEIERLDIGSLADARAFIWLWCGSTPESLQRGRDCLKRWGFRRCEDICWVKTNRSSVAAKEHQEFTQGGGGGVRFGAGQLAAGNTLLQRTKEHCLMGIRGTVRRSNDGDFIHANVDIDLIITEDSPPGTTEKPLEIFLLAEHFCLGRRRLHLFGRDDTLRPGWVTVGPDVTSSSFDATRYRRFFDHPTESSNGGGYTTGCTDRIEQLRPKSPVPMDKRGGGGGGGGMMNMNQRSDGGNSWQRTSGMMNSRPMRGGMGGGGGGGMAGFRHQQQHPSHRPRTPPLHEREKDYRSHNNRGDGGNRNGMVNAGGNRGRSASDQYSTERTSYGSQQQRGGSGGPSSHYGHGGGNRGHRDTNYSRSGVRRNF